jgi:hypothetical protein
MSPYRTLVSAVWICLGVSAGAGAQDRDGPLEQGTVIIWGSLGFQLDFGGNVNSSGVGVLNGRRAELDANAWSERFDPGLMFRVGGAYNLSGDSQLTAAFGWEQAESDAAEAGLLTGFPIEVAFSDYQAWGFDVGYRYFVSTNYAARPFVGGALGFQRIDAMTLTMTSLAGLSVTALPFYDDSWVVQWRVGTGLMWDISDRFGAQVTIDVRYSGVLADVSSIGSLGFERINDQGNRWTFPIMAGAFVKF